MTSKPPSLIECNHYSSSISSLGRPTWDSYRLLEAMVESKNGGDDDDTNSITSSSENDINYLWSSPRNEIKRRNRTNVMLWSEKDVKMFFVRISPELYESDDDDSTSCQQPPAQLPSCFTKEERNMIETSCTKEKSNKDNTEPHISGLERKTRSLRKLFPSWSTENELRRLEMSIQTESTGITTRDTLQTDTGSEATLTVDAKSANSSILNKMCIVSIVSKRRARRNNDNEKPIIRRRRRLHQFVKNITKRRW